MSVELPFSRNVFVPQVPDGVFTDDQAAYLKKVRTSLEDSHTQLFDNVAIVRDVVASGTSGTFLASGGATITVNSGIIVGLT